MFYKNNCMSVGCYVNVGCLGYYLPMEICITKIFSPRVKFCVINVFNNLHWSK